MASLFDGIPDDPTELGGALVGGIKDLGQRLSSPLDPVTKAGLIGFAVRSLMGGWGNTAQQFGGALGAGAESAGVQEQLQQAETGRLRDLASRESIAKEGRASREEIAKLTAANRLEITQERVAGMLARTGMIQGAKTPEELKQLNFHRKNEAAVVDKTIKDLNLPSDQRSRLIEQRALEKLEEDRAAGRFGPAARGPAKAGGPIEEEPAAPASVTKPRAGANPNTAWETIKKNPGFDAAFADPNERAKLRKKGYGPQVDAEEKVRGLTPAPKPGDRLFGPIPPGSTPITEWLKKMFEKSPSAAGIDWENIR